MNINHSSFRNQHCRRGSAYALVLGIAMVVTVLGMAAVTLSRVSAKAVKSGNDWEAAGDLAFSATEHAVSYLNAVASASPSGWRTSFTSGQVAFTQPMGRGTITWNLKDEVDGNLSEDYLRNFRIYGIGKVGAVTRVYSVQVAPGGSSLDVLRTAIHSATSIALNAGGGTMQAINGPFSSAGSVSTSSNAVGSIEAASTKIMPSTSVYSDLLQNATPIACGSTLQNCLVSPITNPYGTANSAGIYSIAVSGNKTLTISNCRIVGTLLISFNNKGTLKIQGPVEWEPASSSYPILVVSGNGTAVNISGSTTWLSEASTGVNFNPSGVPFASFIAPNTNSTMTDDYPPQYRGVMHMMCGSGGSVTIGSNAYFNGTVIADCPVQISAQSTFVQSSAIYSNPPFGYATGNAIVEVPGTLRWDTTP